MDRCMKGCCLTLKCLIYNVVEVRLCRCSRCHDASMRLLSIGGQGPEIGKTVTNSRHGRVIAHTYQLGAEFKTSTLGKECGMVFISPFLLCESCHLHYMKELRKKHEGV